MNSPTSHSNLDEEPSEFSASSQNRDLQAEDGAGLPNLPQVASPAGVHAGNLRRKKEVQFYCKYCSAGFTAKHNLRNHLNSHEGKRPHVCVSCSVSFTTRGVRRRHEKTCKGPTSSLASA
ncbi:hypothetical protein B0H13DRAFT_461703 [Mycena leptocephala]|nr:hypothetical protein B0H13DRAFT_461703 [Mycena leptocephala]